MAQGRSTQIISMVTRTRTSRLSIRISLSVPHTTRVPRSENANPSTLSRGRNTTEGRGTKCGYEYKTTRARRWARRQTPLGGRLTSRIRMEISSRIRMDIGLSRVRTTALFSTKRAAASSHGPRTPRLHPGPNPSTLNPQNLAPQIPPPPALNRKHEPRQLSNKL